jgi:hypothetical protein
LYGIPPQRARQVDRFLDFPPGMGHKDLHNPLGVSLVAVKFGPREGLYAAHHVLDDLCSEAVRGLMRDLFPPSQNKRRGRDTFP